MTRQLLLRTSGPDDTRALASAAAALFEPGDVVSLTGELGAGKTCFVQGAARGLGVDRRVTSPTFTIVRPYEGRLPIVHVDVYRLDRLQDVVELGEETVMGPDQVTFIEWGDTVEALLPPDRLEVEILLGEDDDERIVRLRPLGTWVGRAPQLTTALGTWLHEGTG